MQELVRIGATVRSVGHTAALRQIADPHNYGGDIVTILAGANFVLQKGALFGHRLAIEAGIPVYQDLNGPQMETDWKLTLDWQKAF